MPERTNFAFTAAIVVSALIACACAPEAPFKGVLGVDATAPVFLGCSATAPDQAEFYFSEEVKVVSLRLSPDAGVALVTDGKTVQAAFTLPLAEGGSYVAEILVEDENGNTLSVLVPFRGRNDRIPPLRITEVRTEYSKPKVEFVELVPDAAGQLGGLRLAASEEGFDAPIFEFPPTEVRAGDYVVVFLRTLESAGQTGAAAANAEAPETARVFQIPGNVKRLRKNDAIALFDQDGRIIDAVVLAESLTEAWKTDKPAAAAERLRAEGAWKGVGGTPALQAEDAVESRGATATRTLCRVESAADTDTAADWYIAANGGSTAGRMNTADRWNPNSSKRAKKSK